MEKVEGSTRRRGGGRLKIRPKRLIDGSVTGEFLSIFKGRGSEFEELREYLPGDDIRSIDWKVTARARRPFVRRYIEERELTVVVGLDLSASLRFGSDGTEKDTAARGAAMAIIRSVVGNNDRAGLLLFSDRIDSWTRPAKGRGHALFLEERLSRTRPPGLGTDLAGGLIRLGIVTKRKSLVFVISDWLASGYERPLRQLSLRHDVIPVALCDPLDMEVPDVGLVALRDLETGKEQIVDTHDARVRGQYRESRLRMAEERRRTFSTLGLKPLEIRASEDPLGMLSGYFAARAGGDPSRAVTA